MQCKQSPRRRKGRSRTVQGETFFRILSMDVGVCFTFEDLKSG